MSCTDEGHVWLGDLAGFEVSVMRLHNGRSVPCLSHRCGWAVPLPEGGAYLANVAEQAIEERKTHVCNVHTRPAARQTGDMKPDDVSRETSSEGN